MSEVGHTLVGRSAEMETLTSFVDAAARGSGRIALIEGEAGIGKTRLVAEVLRHAERIGLQVYRSAGEELERRRPFGVVSECLGLHPRSEEHPRAEIATLLLSAPADTGSGLMEGAELEFRVSEAILGLVDDLAGRSPLVLALEDLHWADPSSLVMIHRLGRFAVQAPVCILCTYRPVPRSPELDQLSRSLTSRGAAVMTLGPLETGEVARLVEELVGVPPAASLLHQVAAAGGSPIFITELISALERQGAIRKNGQAEVDSVSIPPSLALAILHRLSFLPAGALETLRLASVLGSRFSVGDLSLISRRSVLDLQGPLRDSIEAGVLGDVGDRLEFRHELIRDALYEDLPAAVRRSLHREIGRALADAGDAPGRVAEHVLRSASPGDLEAVDWLRRAADEAMWTSPPVAAELLERALELSPRADERDEMLAQQAQVLIWSGDRAQAERVCTEVLERSSDSVLEGAFRLTLTWAYSLHVRTADAVAAAQAGLARDVLTPQERARLRALAALNRLFSGDLSGAQADGDQAKTEGMAVGDAWAACTALQTLTYVMNFRGDFAGAIELQDEALRLAEEADTKDAYRLPMHLNRGVFLLDLDRIDEAQEAVERGRRINEELGIRFSLPFHHYGRALGLFLAGDWDDSLAEIHSGLALAEDLDIDFAALAAHSIAGFIALHRDELAEAETSVQRAEQLLAERGPDFRFVWSLWVRALLLDATGKTEEASATAANAWAVCASVDNMGECPMMGPDLVHLTLAAGRNDIAEAITAATEAVARGNPGIPSVEGAALRCRGLIDSDLEALLASADTYRASPRLLYRAAACEDAAAALADTGRRDEARLLFDEAFELYERLGAFRDVRRAETRLRAKGIRRGRRGTRNRPKFGWEALTPTETRVADLVAQGLTNQEVAQAMFLSPHTVHTHVSHVLAKLGLNSRVALAAALAARSS